MDINAQGDVVGFSNPPGAGDPEGEFIARAFRWAYGAATADDLGALAGDLFSEAFAINAHGQVVGVSFGGASGSRAFIWQNGVLANLNDLVDIAPDVLVSAQDINDAGQITGRVRDGVTGEVRAFVATPTATEDRGPGGHAPVPPVRGGTGVPLLMRGCRLAGRSSSRRR